MYEPNFKISSNMSRVPPLKPRQFANTINGSFSRLKSLIALAVLKDESGNHTCAAWGCTTVGKSNWGSTSDVDNNVRSNTGWTDYAVLLHAYGTGYPWGYNNDDSTADLAGNTYYPVCITET